MLGDPVSLKDKIINSCNKNDVKIRFLNEYLEKDDKVKEALNNRNKSFLECVKYLDQTTLTILLNSQIS